MYNFGEIAQKVSIIAQRQGDADYLTKIKDWVNLGQNALVGAYDYWSALQATYRFTSVDGQEQYYLPSDYGKPLCKIIDRSNHGELIWTTRTEYYKENIASVSDAVEGVPGWAQLYGVSAVARVMSAATTVKAKSSSTSDNGNIVVRIEGWLDSSKTILGYENITISTSSPTTYTAGTVSFYGVTRVTKSADTTGYITLADSSDNILATISPLDRQSRYPVLYLGLIPDDDYVYDSLYKRRVKRMENDNDYPFMDCIDFLTLYASGFAFHQEKESETRAEAMWKKSDDALALLLRNEQALMGPDFQHQMIPSTMRAHRA